MPGGLTDLSWQCAMGLQQVCDSEGPLAANPAALYSLGRCRPHLSAEGLMGIARKENVTLFSETQLGERPVCKEQKKQILRNKK